jgi:hypothetical protein
MTPMVEPTAGEAAVFARLIYAGIPAREAAPFVMPFVSEVAWEDMAAAWPRSKPVLDVLMELQGGSWIALTDGEKRQKALAYARRCQAWVLMSQNPQEHVKAEQRALYAACLKDLAAVEAGTAGAGDASTAYFEQALKALQAKAAKAPHGEAH